MHKRRPPALRVFEDAASTGGSRGATPKTGQRHALTAISQNAQASSCDHAKGVAVTPPDARGAKENSHPNTPHAAAQHPTTPQPGSASCSARKRKHAELASSSTLGPSASRGKKLDFQQLHERILNLARQCDFDTSSINFTPGSSLLELKHLKDALGNLDAARASDRLAMALPPSPSIQMVGNPTATGPEGEALEPRDVTPERWQGPTAAPHPTTNGCSKRTHTVSISVSEAAIKPPPNESRHLKMDPRRRHAWWQRVAGRGRSAAGAACQTLRAQECRPALALPPSSSLAVGVEEPGGGATLCPGPGGGAAHASGERRVDLRAIERGDERQAPGRVSLAGAQVKRSEAPQLPACSPVLCMDACMHASAYVERYRCVCGC